MNGKPELIATSTGEVIEHAATWNEDVYCCELSPDGAKVACGHDRGIITMTDLITGARLWEYEFVDPQFGSYDGLANSACASDLVFSSEGNTLAAVFGPGIRGVLLSARTGAPRFMSAEGAGRMGSPARVHWVGDDQILFYHIESGPLHWVWLNKERHDVIHRILR